MASNSANEYQITRSELASAETQLGDLRQRLDREVSQHQTTAAKLLSTSKANDELHKQLNASQTAQKGHTEAMALLKATAEAASARSLELEHKLQEAEEKGSSAEKLSASMTSHIESLQRSLKQEQVAHKATRNFMSEQAEQIRSLQRTLSAVQQQRRQAQQAQLEATNGTSSDAASPVHAQRSHSPISSPKRLHSTGQHAVRSLVQRQEAFRSTKATQQQNQASDTSQTSYISDASSEDDLLGGSSSASGSALVAIRNSKRPSSASTGDPMAHFSRYGRRVRTMSARPRLGASSAGLAGSATEPTLRNATQAYG